MKNYNAIVKAKAKHGEGTFNKEKIVNFLSTELGYSFNNVVGSENKFWITGQKIEGKLYGLINGPKYYQLVVNDRDFGISAGGDLNSWQMAGQIKDEMHKIAKEAK
tara:strand:+ start:173 stop:490 length:318 start_codon:yes stop_codon:yes gene_type:complete